MSDFLFALAWVVVTSLTLASGLLLMFEAGFGGAEAKDHAELRQLLASKGSRALKSWASIWLLVMSAVLFTRSPEELKAGKIRCGGEPERSTTAGQDRVPETSSSGALPSQSATDRGCVDLVIDADGREIYCPPGPYVIETGHPPSQYLCRCLRPQTPIAK